MVRRVYPTRRQPRIETININSYSLEKVRYISDMKSPAWYVHTFRNSSAPVLMVDYTKLSPAEQDRVKAEKLEYSWQVLNQFKEKYQLDIPLSYVKKHGENIVRFNPSFKPVATFVAQLDDDIITDRDKQFFAAIGKTKIRKFSP